MAGNLNVALMFLIRIPVGFVVVPFSVSVWCYLNLHVILDLLDVFLRG